MDEEQKQRVVYGIFGVFLVSFVGYMAYKAGNIVMGVVVLLGAAYFAEGLFPSFRVNLWADSHEEKESKAKSESCRTVGDNIDLDSMDIGDSGAGWSRNRFKR